MMPLKKRAVKEGNSIKITRILIVLFLVFLTFFFLGESYMIDLFSIFDIHTILSFCSFITNTKDLLSDQ